MYVLIVEDDDLVGDGLQTGLAALGVTAEWVRSASAAETAVSAADFDVIILDLGLPDGDGTELLQRWRRNGLELPVLILTARDAVPDRVSGLEAGGDDYLTKPFDLRELAARLHALTRRLSGRTQNVIEYGPICFDPSVPQLLLDGEEIELPRRELAILQALLQRPGRTLTQDQLQNLVYGWTDTVESNALAVHIHHLRRKLGSNLIETVRGVGYRLRRLP